MIDITIQETVNEVDITVNQNVITVNVTRTTGSGGGGVESVTGDLVNNTDPLNPIINTPSFAETLAEDNKTNDIPIVSNNGKAVVDVKDDYLYISYEGNYLTLEPPNGLQLFSDTNVFTNAPIMVAVIDGEISYTCSSFTLNGEEVATQDWVASQGYGTTETLAETLAEDNKTNDIPIISNNGNAVVTVNDDYLQIGYDNGDGSSNIIFDSIQTSITGLILASIYSEGLIKLDAGSAVDISAPGVQINTSILKYNLEEVATQPYADAKVANDLTASTTVAPSKTAVLTEYDMITGLTFSGAFALDKKGGRSYLPYTQTGSLTLSIGGSPIIGSFAVLRFTADGSAITGYAGWKLLSSDAITATNGVVHRVIVYQYEDEIWYSVKLN